MALIFQYGSNMSTRRLNGTDRLNGDASIVGIAKTEQRFQLSFSVWSKTNDCAAASLETLENGVHIYGVVYDVPDYLISRDTSLVAHRKSMDQIEGEGINYFKTFIALVMLDGQPLTALTYLAKNPRTDIRTSEAYAQYILDGLDEHKMPSAYREYVKARIFLNQPNLLDILV